MQGRVLPPVDGRLQAFPATHWQEEPARARHAGVDALEWIYELSSQEQNPLLRPGGVDEIAAVAGAARVDVVSVCADAFMEAPLAQGAAEERARRCRLLEELLESAASLGAAHVLVPFVDASALDTDEDVTAAVEALEVALPLAERVGVEIHIETSLSPERFRPLLDRLPSDGLRVCYDIGNSASLGHDVDEEIATYGDRVGSVHVKDRLRGGGSVPLGEGAADLPRTFRLLRQAGYDGLLVLQVARGETGAEVQWVQSNRERVEELWAEAA